MLKHLDSFNDNRRKIAARYNERLKGVVATPVEKPWARAVYHMYVIRTERRDELQKFLGERNIGTGIHYPVPNHQQPAIVNKFKKHPAPAEDRAGGEGNPVTAHPRRDGPRRCGQSRRCDCGVLREEINFIREFRPPSAEIVTEDGRINTDSIFKARRTHQRCGPRRHGAAFPDATCRVEPKRRLVCAIQKNLRLAGMLALPKIRDNSRNYRISSVGFWASSAG